jgi:16S rRNA processing protein RimM
MPMSPLAADAAADADAPDWPADAVQVGRILGALGLKGWIKVQPHARDPKALFSSRRWYVSAPPALPGSDTRSVRPLLLRITHSRDHGDAVAAKPDGIDDRDTAHALRGAAVYVPRSSFPTAAIDEYYWIDLIGLDVFNREGQALGRVSDLIDTGAHSVLRIEQAPAADDGSAPAERLVPFVAAYVDEVDLAGRRIVVDWGLDY